jgi:hypothetical protein
LIESVLAKETGGYIVLPQPPPTLREALESDVSIRFIDGTSPSDHLEQLRSTWESFEVALDLLSFGVVERAIVDRGDEVVTPAPDDQFAGDDEQRGALVAGGEAGQGCPDEFVVAGTQRRPRNVHRNR